MIEFEMIWLCHKNVFSVSWVWYSFRGARESTAKISNWLLTLPDQLVSRGSSVIRFHYICLSMRTGYPGVILSLRFLTFLIRTECSSRHYKPFYQVVPAPTPFAPFPTHFLSVYGHFILALWSRCSIVLGALYKQQMKTEKSCRLFKFFWYFKLSCILLLPPS